MRHQKKGKEAISRDLDGQFDKLKKESGLSDEDFEEYKRRGEEIISDVSYINRVLWEKGGRRSGGWMRDLLAMNLQVEEGGEVKEKVFVAVIVSDIKKARKALRNEPKAKNTRDDEAMTMFGHAVVFLRFWFEPNLSIEPGAKPWVLKTESSEYPETKDSHPMLWGVSPSALWGDGSPHQQTKWTEKGG